MATFVTSHSYGVDPGSLPRIEKTVLVALARDTARVVTKDELAQLCRAGTTVRQIDSAAVALRARGVPIQNIWGVGYRIDPPDA